jgi:hypothetical protein
MTATLISAKWHGEPQAVKDIWFKKADEAKAEHKRLYPDYVYKPRKSSDKKRRNTKKKEAPAQPPVANGGAFDAGFDLVKEAKLFAQAMREGGYDMSFPELVAEYDGEEFAAENPGIFEGDEAMDFFFPRE